MRGARGLALARAVASWLVLVTLLASLVALIGSSPGRPRADPVVRGAGRSDASGFAQQPGGTSAVPPDPHTSSGGPAPETIQPTAGQPSSASSQPLPPATAPFAEVAGTRLHVPGPDVRLIAFHEAASRDALLLKPLGRCERNRNRKRHTCSPPTTGPDYVILPTRHRDQGATSAVDVAIPADGLATSPVTGRVAGWRPYLLYRQSLDYRLVLIPLGRPDLRVVVIHVTAIRVRKGQRVVAGLTPIASPRVIPFKSDINDYVGPGVPHIHIEVKKVGPPGQQASG